MRDERETRFWGRQRGWRDTVRFGERLIERMEERGEGKKDQ